MAEPDGSEEGSFSRTADEIEEREEKDKLRNALFEDFGTFLLNNILMSVQFFENYEREMTDIRDNCLDESSLDSNYFKSFDSDTLLKLVSTRVTFQRRTDGKKETPELLHPLRTYITYQNVELATSPSSLGGKRVDYNPYYRLIVQRCEDDKKEESGYVNVIERTLTEQKSETVIGGTLIHHPDMSDNNEDKKPKKNPIQSGVVVSKGDEFYVLEPDKRSKPYPLKDYRTNERITHAAAIPNSCFKEKPTAGNTKRRMGVIVATARKAKFTQKILISAAFKRHFCEVFAANLAGHLNLDKTKLETATFHIDHVSFKKQHATHHVTPVLEMKEWPVGTKVEFSNKETKGNQFQWPTKTMETTIEKLGCSLLPIGYQETTDEYTDDYTLEWKIDFPKAEKYLFTHMMHTHVRCYLFVLTLFKTFIGTEITAPHFGPTHMVNLLFLMVRKNFYAWPEYNQGETLTKYLTILEKTLQKKCLKSFFLSQRNLYANTPERIIHKSQTIVMRILQNPIPHILKALMNLKYKDDFYPELDYLKLYNILTVNDLEEYLRPKPPEKVKGRKAAAQPKPKEPGRDAIIVEELLHEKNTPLHRKEILCLFIDHFINVANQSRKYESYEHSMLYLTHARRLTAILSEEYVIRGEIDDFNERIQNGIQHCSKFIYCGDYLATRNVRPMRDITNAKLSNSNVIPTKSDQFDGTRL